MKTNILKTAIASALLMGSAGVSAATHGNLGDSRIHAPLAGATIPAPSTDIWFVAAKDADYYMIDLRQNNGTCGHTSGIDKPYRFKAVLSPSDPSLSCGQENVKTLFDKGVTGYYDETDGTIDDPTDAEGDADLNLCKWRTPDLADGTYQIAVNTLKLGYHSITENRFNCKSDADNLVGLGLLTTAYTVATAHAVVYRTATAAKNAGDYLLGNPDSIGLVDMKLPSGDNRANTHRDPGVYSFAATFPTGYLGPAPDPILLTNSDGDRNYQKLTINQVAPPVAITQKPNRPVLVSPVNGTAVTATANGGAGYVDGGVDSLVFVDDSPEYGKANWYELWITPAGDTHEASRIKDFAANLEFPGWFKVLVDSSELSCTQNPGVGRTCTITLDSPTIKNATAGTEYHWWIRGYNDEYKSGAWSSNVGIFVAD